MMPLIVIGILVVGAIFILAGMYNSLVQLRVRADSAWSDIDVQLKRRSIPEVEDAMAKGQDLLFKKHDPRASLDEFRRAAKLDPWYGPAYMLLGLAQMQLQQWSDAQWAFEEAAKVEPGNAKAYLGAGSALNEQKNYAEAQKALQHSLEIRPDSAEAHYELARSLWGMGKWQAAEPHVRQSIELNKDYAGPHALMGNIYLERGDAEAALAEFQQYLRLDPDGSLAPSVREMIAQLKKALPKNNFLYRREFLIAL